MSSARIRACEFVEQPSPKILVCHGYAHPSLVAAIGDATLVTKLGWSCFADDGQVQSSVTSIVLLIVMVFTPLAPSCDRVV